MNGSAIIAKDRIEEAVGALVGNDQLRARGQRDQAVGQIRKDADPDVRNDQATARKMADKAKAIARKVAGRA